MWIPILLIAADIQPQQSTRRNLRALGVQDLRNVRTEVRVQQEAEHLSHAAFILTTESLADAAKAWGQNDDITVVNVRRNG